MQNKVKFSQLLHPQPLAPYFLDPEVAPIDYTAALATLENFISRNTVTPKDGEIQQDLTTILEQYGFKAINFDHEGITNTLFLRLGQKSKLVQAVQPHLEQTFLLSPENPNKTVSWQELKSQFALARLAGGQVDGQDVPPLSDLPVFAFAGHTDVVPAGNLEQWTVNAPFSPDFHEDLVANPYGFIEEVDDYVSHKQGETPAASLFKNLFSCMQQSSFAQYLQHPNYSLVGRGATDMKSGLIASVFATCALLDKFAGTDACESVSFAFLFTSDEEAQALHGTKYVVEELEATQQKLEWCIIAEPSSSKQVGDIIRNGRRGSASWWLTAKGEQGHVAYPHLVDNPIHKLIPVVHALQTELMQLDQGNSNFPATSFQLVELVAGDGTTNLVPGTARAQFNIRFNDEHSYASLQERVNAVLARFPELQSSLEVTTTCSGESFVTPKDNQFCQDAAKVIGQLTGGKTQARFDTGGGTSDGRFITRICKQMFELGVTNATLHKVNEQVVLGEFFELMQIYYGVMANTLGLVELDLAELD
ncbi:succinyl-diaminopimelate desuccinylase [Psittacicella hinzii]|uniref:Succinyl-diaminopimelate desuccinylase n=1 Tax=Psittacicella hinzii TaxID=2028575 RepID=A0A3A1YAJ2_9GAMM|nr:succinyl-diaminopimelate desuccinylase [Psittacicella hinzii]RIY34249.1 succinyl-diaminopimelate desuccinylase [Psittacicella hinzii]